MGAVAKFEPTLDAIHGFYLSDPDDVQRIKAALAAVRR